MSGNAPTNTDDVIDSRDVIARIEELREANTQSLPNNIEVFHFDGVRYSTDDCWADSDGNTLPAGWYYWSCLPGCMPDSDPFGPFDSESDAESDAIEQHGDDGLDDDDKAELATLEALASEGESSPDWPHGETLIRDSYFKSYAQELAEDCGMIPDNLSWPCTCIDWDRAARELQYDYTSIDFDGITYWIRS